MRIRPCDVAIALGAAVVQVAGTAAANEHRGAAELSGTAVLLLLAGPVALLVRSARPVAPLVVALAAMVGYLALDYPLGPVFLAYVIALVTCVLQRRRTAALLAAGAFELSLPFAYAFGEVRLGEVIGATAWHVAVLALSELARARVEAVRASRDAVEQEALRRAGEERLLVARELHDVLAHSISLISVQAGVALHLMDEQPERAREALVAIKAASGDGLRDLRRTIGVLREDAALAPTPDLSALPRLLDSARASGLHVTLAESGTPDEVDTAVGSAAYRIVQESLTNVTRHSAGRAARVGLAYGDALVVTVDDDGPAVEGTHGGGHGLQGMRERVSALGGRLATGPRPDGGFSVRAVLPR